MSPEHNARGERHLKIQASVGPRKVDFPTNIFVRKEQFDSECVVNHDQAPGLNAMLGKFIIDLQGVEIELFRRDIDLTVQSLATCYNEHLLPSVPLVRFCDHVMGTSSVRREVTKARYRSIAQEIDRYQKGVCLEDIDVRWLKRFEADRYSRGNSESTVWSMMKFIRLMFNEAVRRDIMKPNMNPFKAYEIPETRSRTDVLMFEQVEELELMGFRRGCDRNARDIFCFGCYTGLRWADIRKLRSDDFTKVGDVTWLRVRTQKTGAYVQIPVSIMFFGNALRILEKYGSVEEMVGTITDNSAINRGIRTIMELSGLGGGQHVTMHTARRSCLTALADFGVPIQTIRRIAGHSRIDTTAKYVQISTGMIQKDLESAFASTSVRTVHVDLTRNVLRVTPMGRRLVVGGEVLRCSNCSFFKDYVCRLFHGKRNVDDWCESFSERLPGEPDRDFS